MEQPAPLVRKPLEEPLARIMFGLAVVYLIVLAGLLHRHEFTDFDRADFQLQAGVLGILWLIFLIEGLWRLLHRDRSHSPWKDLGSFLLVLLFPPLRVGARSAAADRAIWLPRLGWQPVDRVLRRRLERFFSVPMIAIALLVLPLLVIHFSWLPTEEDVAQHPHLALVVAIGNGVVWFAFAAEFSVKISVAKSRFLYCTQHWVDLAIIVLPLMQFLPLVQFLPLLRLLPLGRMGRLYRLQGVALKLWRALLLLEVVQRITGRTLEKRLRTLKDLLAAKEEELEELRQEVEEIQKRIAQQKQAAVSEEDDERP